MSDLQKEVLQQLEEFAIFLHSFLAGSKVRMD